MTKVITNPLKVIREKCIDCSGGSKHEADLCQATNCPLFDWRFGKNPNRKKREMTDEQKAAGAARLAKARKAKLGAA